MPLGEDGGLYFPLGEDGGLDFPLGEDGGLDFPLGEDRGSGNQWEGLYARRWFGSGCRWSTWLRRGAVDE